MLPTSAPKVMARPKVSLAHADWLGDYDCLRTISGALPWATNLPASLCVVAATTIRRQGIRLNAFASHLAEAQCSSPLLAALL